MAAKRKGLAVKVLLPAAAIGAVVAVVALTVVWALDSPAAGPPMAAGLAAVVLARSGAGWWLIRRQVTGPLTRLPGAINDGAPADDKIRFHRPFPSFAAAFRSSRLLHPEISHIKPD